MELQTATLRLEPLPYQRALADFLKRDDEEVWRWYASDRLRHADAEAARLDLLKSAYDLDPESHSALYKLADEVAERLAVDAPLRFYQAQQSQSLNASLAFIPGEVHVVWHGPVTERLTETELRGLIGHELAHFRLFDDWQRELLVCRNVLDALTRDMEAQAAHAASARLFDLYTELFADRGALLACGELQPVVSMIVKMETGIAEVSAESYLRQANKIFSAEEPTTSGLTHPETYIRARALQLFGERGEAANDEIDRMIRGPLRLEDLDLLGQERVAGLTRRLIDSYLAPPWIRSEPLLAHARMFFADYHPPAKSEHNAQDSRLADAIRTPDEKLQDFFCYVLLDFVTAESERDELPLAAAIRLAKQLGWSERFSAIAVQEMRLRKKEYQRLEEDAERLLREASEASGEASGGTVGRPSHNEGVAVVGGSPDPPTAAEAESAGQSHSVGRSGDHPKTSPGGHPTTSSGSTGDRPTTSSESSDNETGGS